MQEGVVFFNSPTIEGGTEKYLKFLNRYKNKYAEEPESPFLLRTSYVGFTTIINTINAVGPDSGKIKKYLDETEFETTTGKARFDDHGDLIDQKFVLKQIKSGRVEELK